MAQVTKSVKEIWSLKSVTIHPVRPRGRADANAYRRKNHQVIILSKGLDDEDPSNASQRYGKNGNRQQRDANHQELRPPVLDNRVSHDWTSLGCLPPWTELKTQNSKLKRVL